MIDAAMETVNCDGQRTGEEDFLGDELDWERAADADLADLIDGFDPVERHVHEVMLCASSLVGMRMLHHALSHGQVRLKGMVEEFGDSLYSIRGAMIRMKKRGLFEKRYASQRDVVYVLTHDGHTMAKCIERLFSTCLGATQSND